MSIETDPFVLVVERLKREREELDRMIALLEARIAGTTPSAPNEAVPDAEEQDDRIEETDDRATPENDGEFLGMRVAEAARIVLSHRRRPMSPAAITTELERGGLPVSSSRTIASVLHRRSRSVGDFVSPKRGVWGLKEWYPGRSFGKVEGSDKGEASAPSEPEQPSEPTRIVPLLSNGEP